jgi:hypothetical protein
MRRDNDLGGAGVRFRQQAADGQRHARSDRHFLTSESDVARLLQ